MNNLERPKTTKLRILKDEGLIEFKNAWELIYEDFDKNNGLNLPSLVEKLPKLDDELSIAIEDSPTIMIKEKYENRYYLSEYLVQELDDFVNEKNYLMNMDFGVGYL